MSTPRILALDLGRTTGWALYSCKGRSVSGSQPFGQSHLEGDGVHHHRFRQWLEDFFYTDLFFSFDGHVDMVCFEEVRLSAGTDAAHAYGGFLATLTSWCEEMQIPYKGIPVGTIKKFITGKGNASKAQVMEAVRQRGYDPADDNEADAIACLLCALEMEVRG